MNWHDWGLPILVLTLGLVIGLVVAVRSRGGIGSASRTRLANLLSSRKEDLMAQLLVLEERADRGSEAWLSEVEPIRAEAADCLRDIEAIGMATETKNSSLRQTSRTQLRWTIGSILVLVLSVGLMLYLVQGSTTERVRPAGELFAEATEILDLNPNDLDANNRVSYWHLNQLAIPQLRGVLTMDSLTSFAAEQGLGERLQLVASLEEESSEHLLNTAIVSTLVAALGETDQFTVAGQALASLEETDIDPSVLALWRAFYRYAQGDRNLGNIALEGVDSGVLDEIESRVHTLLRAKLEARVVASVRVLDGIDRVRDGNGLLYITVRDTEFGGMPYAGKRVGVDALAQNIEIDEQDLLPMRQGEPWPETFWIHAYYDADGVVDIGQAEQDPNNVFAEPIGPFSIEDPVEVQQMVLTRVSTAALLTLPMVTDVVQIEAPWMNWDFAVFDMEQATLGGSLPARVAEAMNMGALSEALGLLTLVQERSAETMQTWMYGAILQQIAGESALAQGRVDMLLGEPDVPTNAWVWAAWLSASRGDESGWQTALIGAEEHGANNDWTEFYDYVVAMEPQSVPERVQTPVADLQNMEVSVRLDVDLDIASLEGDVWVVVRAQEETGSEISMISWATIPLDTLPTTVDSWQNTPVEAWPSHVWVDAYVATGAGWQNAEARSARVGPVRRTDSVELLIESLPPAAPPGHP